MQERERTDTISLQYEDDCAAGVSLTVSLRIDRAKVDTSSLTEIIGSAAIDEFRAVVRSAAADLLLPREKKELPPAAEPVGEKDPDKEPVGLDPGRPWSINPIYPIMIVDAVNKGIARRGRAHVEGRLKKNYGITLDTLNTISEAGAAKFLRTIKITYEPVDAADPSTDEELAVQTQVVRQMLNELASLLLAEGSRSEQKAFQEDYVRRSIGADVFEMEELDDLSYAGMSKLHGDLKSDIKKELEIQGYTV